jgi:hypothetical protein
MLKIVVLKGPHSELQLLRSLPKLLTEKTKRIHLEKKNDA